MSELIALLVGGVIVYLYGQAKGLGGRAGCGCGGICPGTCGAAEAPMMDGTGGMSAVGPGGVTTSPMMETACGTGPATIQSVPQTDWSTANVVQSPPPPIRYSPGFSP